MIMECGSVGREVQRYMITYTMEVSRTRCGSQICRLNESRERMDQTLIEAFQGRMEACAKLNGLTVQRM